MPIQNMSFSASNLPGSRGGGPSRLYRTVVARAKAMRMEFLRELWRQLRCWFQKRAALAELHALDDAALKDIGLHRSGIEAALDRSAAASKPQKQRGFAEKQHFCPQQTPAVV